MKNFNSLKSQQGAALFVSLIMLLVLTVLGLSSAQRSGLQEKMAANTHMQHMAFNASEAAVGAFFYEMNTNETTMSTLRESGRISGQCFDESGTRMDCGDVFLDGDKKSVVTAEASAVVETQCAAVCPGYSVNESVRCRYFRIDGKGTVGGVEANTSLWASEKRVCL
ncbi:PilX N-terminal domain-containing pilus assembly protein [Aliikangiella sp. G2MR2-5]|uniref:pilus assembly PilX family protein n=1 Tax=Aliikangiella sp. G2MR2-5 TaxID=2788943 RepID=UPI0018AC0CEC|nr:PilX N-terminal domain-containing pilus assembly protein [Aliikangiella sp. G2MR2-5]